MLQGVPVARLHVEYPQPNRLHSVQPWVQEHVPEAAALSLLWRRRRLQESQSTPAVGPSEPVPHQWKCHAGLETTRCHYVVRSRLAVAPLIELTARFRVDFFLVKPSVRIDLKELGGGQMSKCLKFCPFSADFHSKMNWVQPSQPLDNSHPGKAYKQYNVRYLEMSVFIEETYCAIDSVYWLVSWWSGNGDNRWGAGSTTL